MKKYICRFIFIIYICVPLSLNGSQEVLRTALVMGNWGYQKMSPLTNTNNDGKDMILALRAAGFEVVFIFNGGVREMNAKIQEFGELLKKRQGVGLIYYSGHGIQSEGVNYLVPVDAEAATQDSVKYETIPVDQVLSQLTKANNNFNIIILDACRYDPYTKGLEAVETPGLAKMDAPKGSIIAFATDPGNTSSSGAGRNSLYTKYLLQGIKTPGLSVEDVFKRTLQGVNEESKGKQIPWMSTSFVGDFYFLGGPPPMKPEIPVDESLWQLISDSTVPDLFGEFLKKFPDSPHAADAKTKLAASKGKDEKPVERVSPETLYNQALDLKETDQKRASVLYLQAAQGGYAPAQVKVGTLFRTGTIFGQSYGEALKWYKQAADQGSVDGLFFLASMYETGKGVPVDATTAVSFYKQAAHKGEPYAQEALGDHYLSGLGVERDFVLSTKYYKLAAEQGLEDSQYHLARAYLNGTGVEADEKQALYWSKKSADQGNGNAQEALGECANFGWGMKRDLAEAKKWYQKAIDQGPVFQMYKRAAYNLAVIYNREGEGAIQKALDLYEKAGEAGQPDAWFNMGIIYADGVSGIPQDVIKALKLYEKAGEGGQADAWFNMGKIYDDGASGIPQDVIKALKLYEKAGEGGQANAWLNMGNIYFHGAPGVPQDVQKGLDLYEKAGEAGNPSGWFNMGNAYGDGAPGILVNREKAFTYYKKAAEQGHKRAAHKVSVFYKKGWGVPADPVQADYWDKRSE